MAVLVLLMYTRSLDPAIGFVLEGGMRLLPTSDERLYRDQKAVAWKERDANQFAESERSFTRAIEINPFSAECFYGRAIAREWQGHWPQSLDDANRAIAIEGSRPQYYECRAEALEALGRAADANDDRARADSLRGTPTPRSQPASEATSTPDGP